MLTCPICKDPVPKWGGVRNGHLMLTQDADGHKHVHGDLERRGIMQGLIENAQEVIGMPVVATAQKTLPKEVVFHSRMRIGDSLVMTSGVRDFKAAFPQVRVGVNSTAMHLWDHNPAVDRTLLQTPENTVNIGTGWLTTASNRLDWHMTNAHRVSIEQALGVSIPQGVSRPDIWLTEEEYHAPRVFKAPYWLIVVNGEKGWGCKMYPFERWQAVIDQNPDLTFVQLGTKGDNPPRLHGANVVDYVGRTEDKLTGVRDLFTLFLNAEGSLGLVSFHMHLSGALWKPAVVVAGAREPAHFTKYEGHQYLENGGTLPCAVTACWHCDLDRCTNLVTHQGASLVEPYIDNAQVLFTKENDPDGIKRQAWIKEQRNALAPARRPKCVDLIEPSDITRAIRSYYRGGRLRLDQPSGPTPKKFCHVVPTPVSVAVPSGPSLQDRITQQYGSRYAFKFGGGSLTEGDWRFLDRLITERVVKTVLEFGAGLSTLLFAEKVQVTTYETMNHWIARLKAEKPDLDIRQWDGKDTPIDQPYDLAFVEGPSGGENREHSVRLAAQHARMVVVHDGGFAPEQGWQTKYLRGVFTWPEKAGDRGRFWERPHTPAPAPSPDFVLGDEPSVQRGLSIKVVSTARGWGGCARSLTTLMALMVKAGHAVEFIPFRNAVGSAEFRSALENGLAPVHVTLSYETVRDPCDLLLVYADDFVWEFGAPAMMDALSTLHARQKVMVVNYRRGKIGEIPWTQGWDQYLFLNRVQEADFRRVCPTAAKTTVMAPCTDLAPFFAVTPNYTAPLRVVRHNSQGDSKFAKDCATNIQTVLDGRLDTTIHMMPGPSFVPVSDRFVRHKKNDPPVPTFLASGNVFWYALPTGYIDAGPRAVIEAMAAGLPIVADPWGGVVDRVTPDCGWLGTVAEQVEVLRTVTPEILREKGLAARRRAKAEFAAERWLEVLGC